MSRSVMLATPFVLAVPVLFGLAIVVAGHPFQPVTFAAGAFGWLFALVLRAPIGLLGMRLRGSPQQVQPLIVAASGPLEEGVRLAVLLIVGRDMATALWLGLGWAAIEVLYSIGNGFAMAQLARRDDPEAELARQLLPPAVFSPTAPWWGVVERAFATALHIGFTLIVAALPAAVVATAIVHSLANLGLLALLRRQPVSRVMTAGTLLAATVLIAGLLMHGALTG